MITRNGDFFLLSTKNTSYCFHILKTGQLEHIYYGSKITADSGAGPLAEKRIAEPGNVVLYSGDDPVLTLEDACLEYSSYGKGDMREPFIELENNDGTRTCDFIFEKAEISKGSPSFRTLPSSYDESGRTDHLAVTLKDRNFGHTLELHYFVYEDCDVITRSSRFVCGQTGVKLLRLMSNQTDFDNCGYVFTQFTGEWAREMQKNSLPVSSGKLINSSCAGTSSNRANPFVMLSRAETSEDWGPCYAFNLVYSGNHYECAEKSGFGRTRFVSGINPAGFTFILAPGEDFEAPEAIMTFSAAGFNGMSVNMHSFIRRHIVRGEWKNKERPVLLNSWEAAYFNINEAKLMKLAKAGKEAGMELFVMDDGWFGRRSDDHHSLGDWIPDPKKLPHGLDGLCRKINKLGMGFGIWVEPEMVNTDSSLYRAHPDWTLEIPGKPHSEGRKQRVLDLVNPDVQNFIIDTMSGVFSSADIAYVKWDMNRLFSDCSSQYLSPEKKGETAHRYMIGLYHCLDLLMKKFPHILFEGCASGGCRFDPGMLCYFPQIWASDDTDAVCRASIQTGYSYGYPQSVYTAHVSVCPNHQTLRVTPLETRFNVACFAVTGYECNLCDMSKEDLAAVKAQVALYKEWRSVFQFGQFYRGRTGETDEWTAVSPDTRKAAGFIMHTLAEPNLQREKYYAKGLDPDTVYSFYNRILKYNIKLFGDLINAASPVHIKQGSAVHELMAKFVKLDGETENWKISGSAVMNCGVNLTPSYAGTGYTPKMRFFEDFASRLYFMEAEEKAEKMKEKV